MPARATSVADYGYILGTILFTVYGQIVLKWQLNRVGPLPDAGADKAAALVRLLANPWVLTCALAGLLAMLSWMSALARLPLTHAYPFVSVTFALVLLLGGALFGEAMNAAKVAGVLLIIAGVAVGSRG